MSIYDDVKKAIQDQLAPDLQEIKGEIKALNVRMDALEQKLDYQIDGLNRRLDDRFEGLNQRFDQLIDKLEFDKRLESLERAAAAKPQ